MGRKTRKSCSHCDRLTERVATLDAELSSVRAELARLQEQLAAAKKNSSTSAKPPSSDIVKPPSPSRADGRPRVAGGQPGHLRHERSLLAPEQLSEEPHLHLIDLCPGCGHHLQPSTAVPRVVQQIDVAAVPLLAVEHRSVAGWCPQCQRNHYAPLPSGIERGGLVGPRLTAVIAFLKGVCHASYSTIRKYLRDVLSVTISRGLLGKVLAKVTTALDGPYEELLRRLPQEAVLNVDETGHKERGERWWTWCFRAGLYSLYKIDATRSGDVLLTVLGKDFQGVLGCDYFSAYRRYMRECGVVVQFCLAHLIREIRYLTTLPDAEERSYGERLVQAVRELFGVIHRREELMAVEFQEQLAAARAAVLRVGTQEVPSGRASQNLAKRLARHGDCYFRFLTTPGVEPTNNLAEQAIRFVVIDRLVTQGTRSEEGRRWCERIWTVIATCSRQGRSVFDYLCAAVEAHFAGNGVPSLLGGQG
jgi:transposase